MQGRSTLGETERRTALRAAHGSDAASHPAFDRLARLAARALQAPVAHVIVAEGAGQLSVGCAGLGDGSPRASPGFSACQEVVRAGEPLVVRDAAHDPRLRDARATPEAGAVSYAGVPLTAGDGVVVGALCVLDAAPREWSGDELEMLEALAGFVVAEIQRRGHTRAELLHVTAVLDSADDAVIGFDLEGRITSWNPGAERIFGIPRRRALGRAVSMLFPRELAADTEDMLERVRRGETIPRAEVERLRADGTRVPVSRVLIPVRDLTGNVIGATALVRDLTALRESERRLATLLDNLPGMAYRCRNDPSWTMEFASDGARELLGFAPAELVGEGAVAMGDLMHPGDRERVWAAVQAAVRERRRYELEYRVRTASGEEKWVWEQGQPVGGEPGAEVLEGFITDITDYKRIEEALQESEARFRQLADNVEAVFWLRDLASGRLLYLNPAFERVWGRDPGEFLRDPAAWRGSLHPDDRERALAVGERPRAPWTLEYRIVRPDGAVRWIRERGVPVRGDAGEVTRAAGIAEDVTERIHARTALRRSEARFRALTERSAELISVVTPDARIAYDTPSVRRMLGYTPEEREGTSIFDYLHPHDVERVSEAFRAALKDTVPTSVEVRVRHKDGTYRVLSATGMNLVDEPAVGGIVVNSQDVTELRRGEDLLRQAQKMEAVGRLAGGIAHDFNNILTAIKGTAQLLLLDLPEESPARDDVREIERAAQRAASLTRQLLAFSRRQVLQPQVLDLNAVVREMAGMLRRTLGEDVELVTSLDPSLGRVAADPGQMEQILMNLAVNARDAMPGGGRLRVETRAVEVAGGAAARPRAALPPGRYAVLVVSDTGTGIPDEVRDHVFEPFFTTKAPGKGTGLGLSTVYGIVRQSGGQISLETEVGKGTTFRIHLPLCEAGPAAGAAAAAGDDGAPPPRARGTVLLVEDEATVRKVARRVLQRAGFHVLEAANGEEALRVAAAHPGEVELLLSDVVMPEMGGRELADRLAATQPAMRVLFTSGYTDDAIRHVLDPDTAFLQKPYGPEKLLQKIAEVLG